MHGFTLVDGIVLAVIVVSAILAYARGLRARGLSIVGWIAAALAGFAFAPWSRRWSARSRCCATSSASSCELASSPASPRSSSVALLARLDLHAAARRARSRTRRSVRSTRRSGLLFGIVRGVLLVVIALVVYNAAFGGRRRAADRQQPSAKAIFAGLEQRSGAAMLPAPMRRSWFAGQYARPDAKLQRHDAGAGDMPRDSRASI